MSEEQLKLENQICFPLYAASRLVIQKYKPYLDNLGITYPQYLVLLVLWEKDKISVKQISEKLFLETNTLTPLLKRMQNNGLIERVRLEKDERIVTILLSKKGIEMKKRAEEIPYKLLCEIQAAEVEKEDVVQLKIILDRVLGAMKNNEK